MLPDCIIPKNKLDSKVTFPKLEISRKKISRKKIFFLIKNVPFNRHFEFFYFFYDKKNLLHQNYIPLEMVLEK